MQELDFYLSTKRISQNQKDKGLKAILLFVSYFFLIPTTVFSIIALLIK